MNNSLKNRMIEEHYSLVSIDLFSGPGGLCTGFKWAGILPLIAVEWTDSTVETYATSHNADVLHMSDYYCGDSVNTDYLQQFMRESKKSLVIHGDINQVDNQLIKELLWTRYGIDSENETVDIVSGGAPCESFSLAGKRALGDDRDDLFDNIVRISRKLKTKAILFENVKGIFSKRNSKGIKGAIFQHICDTFEEKNVFPSYVLSSREQGVVLLKACDYGVPQLRERVFLVSIRSDLYEDGIRFVYPDPTYGKGRENPYVTVRDAISDLPNAGLNEDATYYTIPNHYNNENQRRFISIMRGFDEVCDMNCAAPKYLSGTYNINSLSSHRGPGHIVRKRALLSVIPTGSTMKAEYERINTEGRINENVPDFPQFTYADVFPKTIYGSRNRRLRLDEPSFTVTSHCLDELLHPTQNRAISPREAARLQSFPDWYQFVGPYVQFHGDKEQDRYEQIGDAIPPLLAHAMGKQFIACLPMHI